MNGQMKGEGLGGGASKFFFCLFKEDNQWENKLISIQRYLLPFEIKTHFFVLFFSRLVIF